MTKRTFFVNALLALVSGIGCTGKSTKVYVSLHGDDAITVLDGTTHAVVDTISVGQGPAILVETPDHKKLYSANWVSNTVSAVTLATRAVTSIQMPNAARPFVIAQSPDGRSIYAGLYAPTIAVIDTATDTVARTIAQPSIPMSIRVSPDSSTLYVAYPDNTLAAISAATGVVQKAPISVGSFPAWITMSRDGSKVYPLNFLGGSVDVVDTASWQVTTTMNMGAGAFPIIGEPTPDDTTLAVTNVQAGNTHLIDTATNTIEHTIDLGGRMPVGVNFSPDGARGYITDFGDASIGINQVQMLLAGIGGAPFPFELPGRLTVFNPTTGATIDTVTVGAAATSVVVIPAE
ncbi:MAG TPA: hypothetical protein VI072_11010 [Polyangiaceae bacterium]